jgi:hypothetical protein
MERNKNLSEKYSEVLLAIAAAIFGLLFQPILERIIDPLFDTQTKALLTGFVFLALILIIFLIAISILIRDHDKQLDKFETNLVETKNQVRLSTSLSEVGISGAVAKQTETLYEEFCSSPEDELKILQTYFGSLRALPIGLFNAAKRGVKVQILILDPDNNMIRQRLRDVGLPDSVQVHKDSMERLKLLIKRYNPPRKYFEVRLYNRIPPFAMYKADNRIRVGFFWHGEHSPTGPHIFIDDSNSLLGKFAQNTFADIWRTSTIFSVENEEQEDTK